MTGSAVHQHIARQEHRLHHPPQPQCNERRDWNVTNFKQKQHWKPRGVSCRVGGLRATRWQAALEAPPGRWGPAFGPQSSLRQKAGDRPMLPSTAPRRPGSNPVTSIRGKFTAILFCVNARFILHRDRALNSSQLLVQAEPRQPSLTRELSEATGTVPRCIQVLVKTSIAATRSWARCSRSPCHPQKTR